MSTPARAPLVAATVRKLRHHVESQVRHIEIIEQRLRQTMADAGLQSDMVERRPHLPRRPITEVQQRIWNKVANQVDAAPSHKAQVPDTDWWPRRDDTGPALAPAPGWNCYELANQTGKVLAISVFGLESQKLSEILALIASQQRKSRDFTPVFLTSSTAFHLFRRYGFVFEYLPPAASREGVAGLQNWHDYAAQRLELICQKWGINRIICFGPQAIGSW